MSENVKFKRMRKMTLFENIIKSVYTDQATIIRSIIWLHTKNPFELDLTYGKGGIWRGSGTAPEKRFDLSPRDPETLQADCTKLDIESNTIRSVMFDPPFLAGGGLKASGKMRKRYGSFRYPRDLQAFYKKSIAEIYRILKLNGWFIFKCQDFSTSRKNWFFHCHIFNLAAARGFYPKDLFILQAKSRPIAHNFNPETQQMARKYHCYFWVFKKTRANYFTWTH